MSESLANDFMKFYKEVGKMPTEYHQIDRIDNNKGYVEGNLRWATRSQQQRNTRRAYIVYAEGKKYPTLEEAAKHYGVHITTIIDWCKNPERKEFYRELRYS
jgi:hypothetical protein